MKTTESPTRSTMHDILGQVAAEVAEPLTRALERVHDLIAGQSLSATELQRLNEEVAHARRIGIVGQQIARLASGVIRQVPEPLDLTHMLLELLNEHRQSAGSASIEFLDTLANATVMGDSGLAGTMLRGMFDWCSECALTPVEIRLDARPSAAQAILACRFSSRPHSVDAREPLAWHLMQLAADAMGVKLKLDTSSTQTTLSVLFERLVVMLEANTSTSSSDARLLAGRQVLVMAPNRDIRNQVRMAVQGLDLMVDYVTSVDAARDYCADGLPHAVVYASTLAGAPLDRLRRSLLSDAGAPPFIEIAAQGHGFEPVAPGDTAIAKVGLDGLAQALPAALIIELSRRR
jgi:hypothetical protein